MFQRVFIASVLGVSVCVMGAFAAGQRHVIVQKEKAFSVAELTVNAGDAIVFKNDDAVTHNVFSQTPGFEFNFKNQQPGTEEAASFYKTGTVEVRCAIHPKMKTIIHVH